MEDTTRLLDDVISISTVSRHQYLGFKLLTSGCANAKEEVLAVFGALYSLTRTIEGRRDLWSTEDGLFPAPRFGERYV